MIGAVRPASGRILQVRFSSAQGTLCTVPGRAYEIHRYISKSWKCDFAKTLKIIQSVIFDNSSNRKHKKYKII